MNAFTGMGKCACLLNFFQNIKDNISVEIGTKNAITNKKPCLLDFAFGSATNIVTQTMSSMSF